MSVIYIAGDNRSGSTMLDMMLAGHKDIVSIGEAHHIKAYALEDDSYYQSAHELNCLCGQTVRNCEFWHSVQSHLKRELASLELKPFFFRSDFSGRPVRLILKKVLWNILQVRPKLYEWNPLHRLLGGERAGKDSFALYDAVIAASNTRYVLDSSKSPFRLYSLLKTRPEAVKTILLCRDYRGVISSKFKRGISLRKASYHWLWTIQQMTLFSRTMPKENVLRVKYEDLCENPEAVARSIMDFLGLPFDISVINRNHEGVHHIGGSPSKYAAGDQPIKSDHSYKSILNEDQIRIISRIVSNEAKQWGYA